MILGIHHYGLERMAIVVQFRNSNCSLVPLTEILEDEAWATVVVIIKVDVGCADGVDEV